MALAEHRLRAAASARSTTRTRRTSTSRSAAASGGCSTRAGGSTPRRSCIKEALTRWVAPAVTGTVTLELRRGDDYTLLDTKAARSAYEPDKLSMEKTASAFTPEDRVGALEMQSLGVLDNRELLLHFAKTLGKGAGSLGDLLLGDGTERTED